MKAWDVKAGKDAIEKTMKALTANGIEAHLAANGAEAKKAVLSMVPAGAETFTMTSITLEQTGITKEINESGRYVSVRNALTAINPQTQLREQRKLGAAPDVTIGSAHAVTETGTIMFASLTGSQLAPHVYGAGTVILVVGAQKIVRDVEEGIKEDQRLPDWQGKRAGPQGVQPS